MSNSPHIPVLTQEILGFLSSQDIRCFVDGTLGAGGHALRLLEEHREIHQYVGIDQDDKALDLAKSSLSKYQKKVCFLKGNFVHLEEFLHSLEIPSIDGMLMDLGVSSMQLDQGERGFSFSHGGPLDMRMNQEGELTACDIVNHWSEKKLGEIFRYFGEEKKWRQAARAILEARHKKKITQTQELVKVLQRVLPQTKGKHFATRVFQALRIAVNDELGILEKALHTAVDFLNPGKRLLVISFHSLEDRIVKTVFRKVSGYFKDEITGERDRAKAKILTKKPLVASSEEKRLNPRSRSAKLRVLEKL